MAGKGSRMKNTFKNAFAFGDGFALGNVLVSLVFIALGVMLYKNGVDKEKEGEKSTMKMIGVVFLILGAGPFMLSHLDVLE